MDYSEKINFFNSNYIKIFQHESNSLISFVNECTNSRKLRNILNEWPDDIKIKIVDSYLANLQ